MNDMSSKELQQPQVESSLDANRHRSAVEKTLEGRLKGRIPERITQTLRMLRQNAAATVLAGLFAVGNANCNNVEQQNTPPPIPPPAVSQMPEGMPSSTIEFTDSRKHVKDEAKVTYSEIIDKIEATAENGIYFMKGTERTKAKDTRVIVFQEPIEQKGYPTWIVLTSKGPKSFSLELAYSLYKQDLISFMDKAVEKKRSGIEPNKDYVVIIHKGKDGQEISFQTHFNLTGIPIIVELMSVPLSTKTPTNNMVVEAITKSQKKVHGDIIFKYDKRELSDAKSLSEALEPILNPQQPPSPPPPPPQ